MRAWRQAQRNNLLSARAITALLAGEKSEEAETGALLISGAFDDLRVISRFCMSFFKK